MVSKDITIMTKEEQITIKAKKMSRVLQALNEIKELKEKEKNLLKQLKDSEKELLEVTQNVVSKDRIEELIFYINKDIEIRDFKRMHMQHTTTDSYEIVYSAKCVKEMLKKLLEEKKYE